MNVCKLLPTPSTLCSQGSLFFHPFPLQPQDEAHDSQSLPKLHMGRVDWIEQSNSRGSRRCKAKPWPSERDLLASYLRQNQSLTSSQTVGEEVGVLPTYSQQLALFLSEEIVGEPVSPTKLRVLGPFWYAQWILNYQTKKSLVWIRKRGRETRVTWAI